MHKYESIPHLNDKADLAEHLVSSLRRGLLEDPSLDAQIIAQAMITAGLIIAEALKAD